MNQLLPAISPQTYARSGGILYLIMIVLGIINEVVVRGTIVVPGNIHATTAHLQSNEQLWRMGIAIELLMILITLIISLVVYVLTKPVQKELALLALLFGLLAVGVQAAYTLHLLESLFTLTNHSLMDSFTGVQLEALSYLSIKTHGLGFAIALLLFGPFFFLTGYLIYYSRYLPKLLGLLYVIPGISYMVSSFILVLAPAVGAKYYFLMAGPALIGELSLSLWLILKGVDMEKWNEVMSTKQQGLQY